MKKAEEVPLSDGDIDRRRDDAIRRALTTPPRKQNTDPRPQTVRAAGQQKRRSREWGGKE